MVDTCNGRKFTLKSRTWMGNGHIAGSTVSHIIQSIRYIIRERDTVKPCEVIWIVFGGRSNIEAVAAI